MTNELLLGIRIYKPCVLLKDLDKETDPQDILNFDRHLIWQNWRFSSVFAFALVQFRSKIWPSAKLSSRQNFL